MSQAYPEHSQFLAERVVDFLAPGLTAGEAVVVIATPTHAAAIDAELDRRGIDLASARHDGRFVSLDAVRTMKQFMVGDQPDRQRFVTVVGGAMEGARLQAMAPVVRAFGEMVAVLWAQGRITALALEDVWNDVLGQHPFSRLCEHPLPGLSKADIQPARAPATPRTRRPNNASPTRLRSMMSR